MQILLSGLVVTISSVVCADSRIAIVREGKGITQDLASHLSIGGTSVTHTYVASSLRSFWLVAVIIKRHGVSDNILRLLLL